MKTITLERVFRATPEKLYTAFTDEQHLTNWFGCRVEADPRVGGAIKFHFGDQPEPVSGQYKILNPYEQVSFTWTSKERTKEPDTIVHITFKKENDKTRMTLQHEGFADEKAYSDHAEGWFDYMELWSVRNNSGPEEAPKVAISQFFSSHVEISSALSKWFSQPVSEFKISHLTNNSRAIQGKNFEVHLTPSPFGTCVALCEWGYADETERLAARKTWAERFSELRKQT